MTSAAYDLGALDRCVDTLNTEADGVGKLRGEFDGQVSCGDFSAGQPLVEAAQRFDETALKQVNKATELLKSASGALSKVRGGADGTDREAAESMRP